MTERLKSMIHPFKAKRLPIDPNYYENSNYENAELIYIAKI